MRSRFLSVALAGAVLSSAACSDSSVTAPPLEVDFGETTFVVVVNPTINDDNEADLPEPGSVRSGVNVSVEEGGAVSANSSGIAVLAPVPPGERTLSFQASGVAGDVVVPIEEGDLLEVVVALTEGGAATMASVRYAFGGEVVELTPDTPPAEVNHALSESNVIVFLRGGTYTGDLEFTGSNVILFGEGPAGGQVTIHGNVAIGGSSNRVRGARVTGDLVVTGSDAGISFSRVAGTVTVDGSSAVLIENAFCGEVTLNGSTPTLLGNAGLDPLPAPANGC